MAERKIIKGTKLSDIIDNVRKQISDVGEMYDEDFFISVINSALPQLARKKGLRRMFKLRYQAQLATVNADGKPAARWDIEGITVVGKERLNFAVETDCYKDLGVCYKSPSSFFSCYRFPELECPGDPCSYTIETINGVSTIISTNHQLTLLCWTLYFM